MYIGGKMMIKELVDCRPIQEEIKESIRQEIKELGITPKLTIVQVGEDYASTKYVNQKIKHSQDVGIEALHIKLPETITTFDLIREIKNAEMKCDGLIVQLPLPRHIDEAVVLESIYHTKDADCLTDYNIGLLHTGKAKIKPCTAYGVMELLERKNYELQGKKVLIIGRGHMTGYPLFNLMLSKNATVTIAHSKTDLDYYLSLEWDVIVASVGKAKFLKKAKADFIVDIGINYDENGKMCGDVDTEACEYNYCTMTPNGVGRLTVAMLLKNTLELCKEERGYND